MIVLQLIDRILARIEGWLIIAMLSLMVIFTFFQVVLRGLYTHGHLSWANTLMGQIDWSEPFVRLLILWITFLGASLLTRDGKHIQIDLFASILPPRWLPLRDSLLSMACAAICAIMIKVSMDYLSMEMEFGGSMFLALPTWTGQIILPAGFALLLDPFRTQGHRPGNPIRKEQPEMIFLLVLILIILVISGLPLFIGIIGAALLGLYANGVEFTAIPIEMVRLANAPILLAIPLFAFAGYLLSQGGTSGRLVRFSRSLLGWLPGGLGVVALVTCSFFTALTGATGITIIALGGLLYPALISERYRENFALGLMTTSGSLGLHFPPSLPIILYGFVSGTSIEKLFMAGLIPGILVIGLPSLYSIYMGKKWRLDRPRFSAEEFLGALKGAAWELPIPFLILAGIYSGLCTATEAAALTVVYVLLIKIIIFRELKLFKDLPEIMKESMKMVGGIMIILGAALAFTNYLVDAFIPMKILSFMEGLMDSKIGFLILLNIFLLLVGCMMDIFSAILVVVPLILPLADRFGIDPVHMGIIFLTNLAIGYNTPPVGLNLFIASSRFDRPVVQLYRATLPFLVLLLLALVLITYCPGLSLFLPGLFK